MAIGMRAQPKGLFGKTPSYGTPGIGDDTQRQRKGNLFGAPGMGATQQEQPGKKRSVLPYVFAALEDTMARQMGYQPGGVARLNEGMAQQQQAAAQAAAEQRKRSLDMADWQAKEEYQRANPMPSAPDAFERTLAGAGIDPNSEEGRALYRERAASMAGGQDEFVVVPVPGGTYAGPKSGLPAAMGQGGPPPAPVGNLRPEAGGGGGNVTSGFLDGF